MGIKRINFSNKYATGSIKERREKAEKLSSQIYDVLMDKYQPTKITDTLYLETSHIPLKKVEKIISNNLPERLNFYLTSRKSDKNYEACVKTMLNGNKVFQYRMELPMEKGEFSIFKVPVLMHELSHLLDNAFNPQYRVVVENINKAGIIKDVNAFYKQNFYTLKNVPEKELSKKIKTFLKNLTLENKLLVLRFVKLYMRGEINAHAAEKNYRNKFIPYLTSMPLFGFGKNDVSKYKFKEKIELVDKIRYDLIKKEHIKNKRKCGFRRFMKKIHL